MKVLITDDEPLARERLQRLLQKLRPDMSLYHASNGVEALEIVQAQSPELILLDIRMPGMDGIEVATHLQQLEQPPAIIFCTAYDQYALAALQHEAVAYLLKPVREDELAAVLDRAGRINRLQLAALRSEGRGRERVSAHTHRGLETLAVADIRCFIAEQKYVTAIAPGRDLLLPDTLKELEQEFKGEFFRVHRNTLVALSHIRQLTRDESGVWLVELDGLSHRPGVGRRHVTALKECLRGAV